MSILVLNFSGRENGNCENIAKVIQEELKNVEVINFNQINIFPCSNCNYECFKNKNECPYIIDDAIELYEKITNSNLVYYIIPNYCGFPNSNYFIFNERGCSYFNGDKELMNKFFNINKKIIVVSNSNQEGFKNILKSNVKDESNILFLSTRKYNQNSIDGTLMNIELAKQELIQFIKKD